MTSDRPVAASRRMRPSAEVSGKLARYAAGSVVATACSEVAFVLLYGPLGAAPVVASVVGWLAGAVPNYWLNRTWTWRRRGRPSLSRELAPYAAIVLGTLALATVATSLADSALDDGVVPAGVRVVLVGGIFLLVYAVVFMVRFLLLDKLFGSVLEESPPADGNVGHMPARETT